MTQSLDYQNPVRTRGGLCTVAAVLLTVAWFWVLFGLVLILMGRFSLHHHLPLRIPLGIKSIIYTGPVLEVLGVASLVTSLFARSTALILAAVGPVGFPVLIFSAIVVLRWGPSEAELPVIIAACGYLASWFFITAIAWIRR